MTILIDGIFGLFNGVINRFDLDFFHFGGDFVFVFDDADERCFSTQNLVFCRKIDLFLGLCFRFIYFSFGTKLEQRVISRIEL
jgi:hypothetical protein